MIPVAIAVYALAIISANLLVLRFGPPITPLLAFFLVGLDLALRNWLNLRMRPLAMGILILATGALTYLVNPAARSIAIASAVAFTAAALADWATFRAVSGSWIRRNVAGATVGAAVDSVLFPTLAFGALLPALVLGQFVAKVAGAAAWGWLIRPRESRAR